MKKSIFAIITALAFMTTASVFAGEAKFTRDYETAGIGFRVYDRPFGVFPQTHTGKSGGQVQPVQYSLKRCLTILSSNEWKVIIAKTPSLLSESNALSSALFRWSSSPLTAILIA